MTKWIQVNNLRTLCIIPLLLFKSVLNSPYLWEAVLIPKLGFIISGLKLPSNYFQTGIIFTSSRVYSINNLHLPATWFACCSFHLVISSLLELMETGFSPTSSLAQHLHPRLRWTGHLVTYSCVVAHEVSYSDLILLPSTFNFTSHDPRTETVYFLYFPNSICEWVEESESVRRSDDVQMRLFFWWILPASYRVSKAPWICIIVTLGTGLGTPWGQRAHLPNPWATGSAL